MNKSFKYVTGLGVIAMALVLAYYLKFTNLLWNNVYGGRRTALIWMLIGYSIFRAIRLVQAYKKDKLDEKRRDF